MANFVNLHKVIVKRNAFSAFSNIWNEIEPEGEVESEKLKHQFSQVEGDLNWERRSLNRFSFQTRKHPQKK